MRLKSAIVERLNPAYKSGDLETIAFIKDELIPEYSESLERLSEVHAYHKDTYLRPFGTELVDALYGKMKERAKTVRRRLGAYLDGKISAIAELDEPRLGYQWGIIL